MNFDKDRWNPPFRIECDYCSDTGVCFVHIFDNSIEMLMGCVCETGKKDEKLLPKWNDSHKQKSMIKKFPEKWFKPTDKESIWSKAAQWNAKIKVAEEFWGINGETILGQQAQT